MKHILVTGFLNALMSAAVAKTTPKAVAIVLALGLAAAATVLATKAEGSNLWTGPEGGAGVSPSAFVSYGNNFGITPDGGIWVYPNNKRAKGENPVYVGTYFTSYQPRSSRLFTGWAAAMQAYGAMNRPGSGYHGGPVGNIAGSAGTGYQGYTTGSRLKFDTGQPQGGYFDFNGAGSRGLWSD